MLVSSVVLTACNQLPTSKPPPPEFTLAELFEWSPEDFTSAFGDAAVVVETPRGRDYYWEAGEQEPTLVISPEEFARLYPVTDYLLLPFTLIVSFQREKAQLIHVARSHEPPASRIGFTGENLRLLKRDDILQDLEVPDETAQVGLRQEESQFLWHLSAGRKPLSSIPWGYTLAITCDKLGRVTSVRAELSM